MKILLQTTDYKEIDIELPFYAYCQEDNQEIYVMIDEKYFRQITIHLHGEYSIFKSASHGSIASVWYGNQTTKDRWDDACKHAKMFINTLNI